MGNHRILLWLLDVMLVLVASVSANELRNNYGFSLQSYLPLLPYLFFTVLCWSVASFIFKTNLTIWRYSSLSEYLQIALACIFTSLGAAGLSFVYNRMEGVARSLPVLQFLVVVAALVGARVLMRLRHARRHRPIQLREVDGEKSGKTVLLMGLGPLCDLYLRSLAELGERRIHVAGLLGRNDEQTGRFLQNVPVLGTPENVEQVLRDLTVHGVVVDEIVVASAPDRLSKTARRAIEELNERGVVSVRFLAENLGFSGPGELNCSPVGGAEIVHMPAVYSALSADEVSAIARRRYWALKRVIDVAVAAALLVVLSPIMLAIAILVAIDLGFPVTFWQRRPGLGGRPFRCLKFRTMRQAFDTFGLESDAGARLSAIGRGLRAVRLDELPQLLNILVGDMSLVGPRPLLPADQPTGVRDRLLVRPGMTGWAQVCGGRTIDPADKSALDIWYIRHASWWLDLRILLKTIAVICGGERVDVGAIKAAREQERGVGNAGGSVTRSCGVAGLPRMKRHSTV